MNLSKEEYQPLQGNSEGDEYNVSIPKKRHSSLVAILFIASLCLNGLMGVYIALLLKEEGESLSRFGRPILSLSKEKIPKGNILTRYLAGLARDESVVYHTNTEFSDTNDTAADIHWDALDTEFGIVTLKDDYAQRNGLTLGDRFPWNHEKGIYWLDSSHNLHCLVRKAASHSRTIRLISPRNLFAVALWSSEIISPRRCRPGILITAWTR